VIEHSPSTARRLLVAVVALCALASAAPATAAKGPVPSLQPVKTAKLWKQLIERPRANSTRTASTCRPLRAVFYTASDWLRLATKLAAAASPCAEYSISIPPLVADKTTFRYDQPWRIRALGPNFHVLAEIHMNAWTTWVANNGGSWYAAGVEARRRMAASGFDLASGDSWSVNEFSTAVRRGDGDARANVRELVHGLYEGDGTGPRVKGAVLITGFSQSGTYLSVYKANLQAWFEDTPFWNDMSAYVSDWSQEVYGDVRNYAAPGASLAQRRDALKSYLAHELTLVNAAPDAVAPARDFLRASYNPLANAAWQWDSAYGWTAVPYAQMQDYVSAQTYALRSLQPESGSAVDRFGFAWAPKVPTGMTSAEFATQSGYVLDRLGPAIRDSGSDVDPADPGLGACAPEGTNTWCSTVVDGGWLNSAWNTFTTWAPSALGFIGAPATGTAGSGQALTVQLQVAGVERAAATPVSVNLSTSSAQGAFSPAADGPWTQTLDVTVPAGATSATFVYRDTRAGTATLSASSAGRVSAAHTLTIAAGPLAQLALTPPSATVAAGAARAFSAAGADAYGNAVAVTPAWSLSAGTPGTLSTATGVSTTFAASAAVGGSGAVVASAGDVKASAPVVVTAPKLRVASIAYAVAKKRLVVTFTVVRTSDGQRVPGASLAFTTNRNGVAFASATVQTASDGRAVYTSSSQVKSGCYSTTVRSLSGAGLAWDGSTPANQYCR
jgi:hypothetical protein